MSVFSRLVSLKFSDWWDSKDDGWGDGLSQRDVAEIAWDRCDGQWVKQDRELKEEVERLRKLVKSHHVFQFGEDLEGVYWESRVQELKDEVSRLRGVIVRGSSAVRDWSARVQAMAGEATGPCTWMECKLKPGGRVVDAEFVDDGFEAWWKGHTAGYGEGGGAKALARLAWLASREVK